MVSDDSGEVGHVRHDRYVAFLRSTVPEFEPIYRQLGPEDRGLGSFEVVSEFARWAALLESEEVRTRAFNAIERAETESERLRWNEASGLTTEFCEVLAEHPDAVRRYGRFMGPWVSGWFTAHA